jgi:predicted secreted hydrolase
VRLTSAVIAALLVATLACADAVSPGIRFPIDTGSHPDFRTEWWYVTGWLQTGTGEALGFQVTFFRTRPGLADGNPSAFAARQLIIAHAALSDPAHGRLYQDQRVQRAAFGLADAASGATHAWIDDWYLQAEGSAYRARIDGGDFTLALRLQITQPPLLNGEAGLSRKGAAAAATSWYYSEPQLQVSGTIARDGRRDSVQGVAWLDHEWSNEYLEAGAVGWDWIGINLDDGGALMAFRIRGADGQARWSGATLRGADGSVQRFAPDEVAFEPGRLWTSPRTAIRYPVQWRVRVGKREFSLQPLLDDQESDTRLSSGTIYWEGAVRALDGTTPAGRGYLELTGYGAALKLP